NEIIPRFGIERLARLVFVSVRFSDDVMRVARSGPGGTNGSAGGRVSGQVCGGSSGRSAVSRSVASGTAAGVFEKALPPGPLPIFTTKVTKVRLFPFT